MAVTQKNHTAKMLNGRQMAQDLQRHIGDFVAQQKSQPALALILVGQDAASEIYVRSKIKAAQSCGIGNREFFLPEKTTEQELLALIEQLNKDETVHGILLQLPLPAHIREKNILNAIAPKKDVDGFHIVNTGRLYHGFNCFMPCTAIACLILIRSVIDNMAGRHAVVVGRSNIVGKPVAEILGREGCTVTVAHRDTRDLPSITKQADILVVATGNPHLIGADHVKDGAIIIDVGINRLGDGKIVGDVDFDAVVHRAEFITPVPGGVGPMTIACLLMNTVKAFALQQQIAIPDFCL